MSDDREYACRVCDTDLSDRDVPRMIPYCEADTPNKCPKCGCSDIGYSGVRLAFVCDNGCGPWRPEKTDDDITSQVAGTAQPDQPTDEEYWVRYPDGPDQRKVYIRILDRERGEILGEGDSPEDAHPISLYEVWRTDRETGLSPTKQRLTPWGEIGGGDGE